MKAILDTNLLIAGSLVHPEYELAVSSLSWAELGYGIRKVQDPLDRLRRQKQLARWMVALGAGIAFDDEAAKAYETVCGLVLAQGRQVRGRAIDLMIAATAVANGAAILTRNPNDFIGLESLVNVVVV